MVRISTVALGFLVLISCVPFDLRKRWRSISLYLPFLSLVVFLIYETNMRAELSPESVPIRIDLLILHPLLVFLMAVGILRWGLVLTRRADPNAPQSSGRTLQIVGALLIGVVCFIWFCIRWW